MTVGELIANLQAYEHDLNVVLARDLEGSGFLPLDHLSHQPMTSRSKSHLEYDPEGEDAVILWPLG